ASQRQKVSFFRRLAVRRLAGAMFSPLPVFRDLDRWPDIRVLRALVACTQQQRDRRPALLEIDSVAGTVIDTHFAHARADRLHVSGITEREAADACSDARLSGTTACSG